MLLGEISASFTSRSPGIATLGPSWTPSPQLNQECLSHRVLIDPRRLERFAENDPSKDGQSCRSHQGLRSSRLSWLPRGTCGPHAVRGWTPTRQLDRVQKHSTKLWPEFRPERNDQEAERTGRRLNFLSRASGAGKRGCAAKSRMVNQSWNEGCER